MTVKTSELGDLKRGKIYQAYPPPSYPGQIDRMPLYRRDKRFKVFAYGDKIGMIPNNSLVIYLGTNEMDLSLHKVIYQDLIGWVQCRLRLPDEEELS